MSNLHILTPSEQQAFDCSPALPSEIQTVCFSITNLLEEVDLSSYKKKMPIEHRKKILNLLDYKPFDEEIYAWLKKEVLRLTEQQVEPRQIFIHLIDLLQHHKTEVPSYHRLAEMITLAYAEFENGLLVQLRQNITDAIKSGSFCRDANERNGMVSMIKNCSVIIWRHINLHGEYDFKRQAVNDNQFDMDKILALQVA